MAVNKDGEYVRDGARGALPGSEDRREKTARALPRADRFSYLHGAALCPSLFAGARGKKKRGKNIFERPFETQAEVNKKVLRAINKG